MDEQLIEYVERIIGKPPFEVQSGIERAINGPGWAKTQAGQELVQYLEGSERYQIFNEHLQYLGSHGSSVSLTDLANWVVGRSFLTTPVQASKELNEYVDSTDFEAISIFLISGLHTEDEYEFCNGVKLLNATAINNRRLSEGVIVNSYGHGLPVPRIESVLCKTYKNTISHKPNTEFDKSRNKQDVPIEPLEDVRLALILVRPDYGVHTIAHGALVEDGVPIIHSISGWGLHPHKLAGPSPSLINIHLKQADAILNKILKLEYKTKLKLKISIDRLNGYYSCNSIVDKAIDLRVCMESIFLTDGNKEQLRYSLALRAAQFLAKDADEKIKINKIFKTAYDVTSTAVHNGVMPSRNVEYLKDAARYAREAILRIIEIGNVEWTRVELGI